MHRRWKQSQAFAPIIAVPVSSHPVSVCPRRVSRACASAPQPERPSESLVVKDPQQPALTRQIPSLFRGPEAVLGIVIAAAALLADFTRNLVRLTTRRASLPILKNTLAEVDDSINQLQTTLDVSKSILTDTERRLDESLARANTAETALLGIGDTRDAMLQAREQTARAEEELARIKARLQKEAANMKSIEEAKIEKSAEKERLELVVGEKDGLLEQLRQRLDSIRQQGEQALEEQKQREEMLRAEVTERDEQLQSVAEERSRLGKQASDMEQQAIEMSEQVEAAERALDEAKMELEQSQAELQEQMKAQKLVGEESARAVERGMEVDLLRKQVNEMEGELGELQSELRSRDQVVNEVSSEADELRSLLAARDAELGDLTNRLESALSVQKERGGDTKLSDLSLEEIKNNLDAEKLALSAEIGKAELASFDITESDLDPLDRLKKEMEVEGDLFQAGLRKAESTVLLEEHSESRKSEAVEDVLGSVPEKADSVDMMDRIGETGDMKSGGGSDKKVSKSVTVAKQAQSTKGAEKEAKPKKRRGRPPKKKKEEESGKSSSSDGTAKREARKPRK